MRTIHQAFSRRSRCEEAQSDLRFTIYPSSVTALRRVDDLRWAGNFCFLCVPLVLSLIASARADSTASGPDISVPKDLPRDETHKLPERNWIDQTQEEAAGKSRGCLECHAGSEPMHASPNVVLGCTDCHGG